jgi:hypothetical protein
MQLREYEDGALVREEPIPAEQLEAVLGKRAAPVKRRQRRARAKVTASAGTLAAARHSAGSGPKPERLCLRPSCT